MVVLQALHTAVDAGPHMTPAAYSPAAQFKQADDMRQDMQHLSPHRCSPPWQREGR